jgi:hypothetical protein
MLQLRKMDLPKISLGMINKAFKSIKIRSMRLIRRVNRTARVHLLLRGFAKQIEYVYRKHSETKDIYNLYQEFYVLALEEMVRFRVLPDKEKFDEAKHGKYPLSGEHHRVIGQYVFVLKNKRRINVAIDSDDHPSIQNQNILEWAHVYFKTNLWPDWKYPGKVHPIVTGNNMVHMDSVGYLKSLRKQPKLYDFIFVSRIYAGPGANVEHNIRLFEELAKISCRSKIRAIFIGFKADDPEMFSYRKRLEACGVEATTEHFSFNELMTMSAQSRLCVIRAGIHSCITWRLINMLCIGAAVVLDANPFSSWPEPLREGENFLSLGLRITSECGPAPDKDYESIVSKMEKFLINEDKMRSIHESNCRYFDEHAHPMRVASYILDTVKKY